MTKNFLKKLKRVDLGLKNGQLPQELGIQSFHFNNFLYIQRLGHVSIRSSSATSRLKVMIFGAAIFEKKGMQVSPVVFYHSNYSNCDSP